MRRLLFKNRGGLDLKTFSIGWNFNCSQMFSIGLKKFSHHTPGPDYHLDKLPALKKKQKKTPLFIYLQNSAIK